MPPEIKGMSTREKLWWLARQFPSLRSEMDAIADDKEESSAALSDHLQSGAVTGGSRHAAQFCLHVFNTDNPFNLGWALNTWDSAHMAVFQSWARDPWTL